MRFPWGDPPRRVLLTGAAGRVATLVWPQLRAQCADWRWVDRVPTREQPLPPAGQLEQVVQDLSGVQMLAPLLADVDAVIHLAGQATHAPREQHQHDNVQLLGWILEAMQQAGVTRLVTASSMHVLGRYRRTTQITPSRAPRPSGPYGESKLAAEAMVRRAASQFPLQALVLRLGHVVEHEVDAEPGNWLAADDLCRLLELGLRVRATGVTTINAVTPHMGDDLGQAQFSAAFGMQWRTDAPSYRDAMRRVPAWYGDDAIARRYRGGVFVARGW